MTSNPSCVLRLNVRSFSTPGTQLPIFCRKSALFTKGVNAAVSRNLIPPKEKQYGCSITVVYLLRDTHMENSLDAYTWTDRQTDLVQTRLLLFLA